jgi:hypothetical protein
MARRTFRPGQFGIFTVVQPDFDFNDTVTKALSNLTSLRLKSVDWIDLGSGIIAVLFSSFRNQIYLGEWLKVFKYIFENTSSDEHLRENSIRVVKIMADTRQRNSLNINRFSVLVILLFFYFWQGVVDVTMNFCADFYQRGRNIWPKSGRAPRCTHFRCSAGHASYPGAPRSANSSKADGLEPENNGATCLTTQDLEPEENNGATCLTTQEKLT